MATLTQHACNVIAYTLNIDTDWRLAAIAGLRRRRWESGTRAGHQGHRLFAAPAAMPSVYWNALPVGYTTSAKHERIIGRAAESYLAVITWAVMASHGRRGLAGAVRGSVAHGVAQRSPVPVLIVK
jgi:hypothetical protein